MAPGQKKLSELLVRAGLRCDEQGIEGSAVFVFRRVDYAWHYNADVLPTKNRTVGILVFRFAAR